jgi:hypothetical protein
MESVEPQRTPLTDQEKKVLIDESTKMDSKLAKVLSELNTNQEEFPDIVEIANVITNP